MKVIRTIVETLRKSGRSNVVRVLTADHVLPNIKQAVVVYNSEDIRQKEVFIIPRTTRTKDGCAHFAFTVPEKRQFYQLLMHSEKALRDLGLLGDCDLVEYSQGSRVFINEKQGIFPYSLAYAGFQFGQFAGQLGDGRVVNLFDIPDCNGTMQTLQIKGAGLTPYSRFADGKATLAASIREFVVSEALHAIGIPSIRALQITLLPGTIARRSMYEPCATVTRFAPSWIRIGNFDLFKWKGDYRGLQKLVDFCIKFVFDEGKQFPRNLDVNVFKKDYFSQIEMNIEIPKVDKGELPVKGMTQYDLFFRHVVNLNAETVAYWQAYGFCNGVLNTDNVSILGLSLDFGPFAFMDKFQPKYTPNKDDITGRYSYENQPNIMWWNLTKFAEAISLIVGAGEKYLNTITTSTFTSVLSDDEVNDMLERASSMLNLAGNEYKFRMLIKYADIMARRLGIDLNLPICTQENLQHLSECVKEFLTNIVQPMLRILEKTEVNYNCTFISLQEYNGPFFSTENTIQGLDTEFVKFFFNNEQLQLILANFEDPNTKMQDDGTTRKLVETFEELKKWTRSYTFRIPEYKKRLEIQSAVNPILVPRNHMLNQVIESIVNEYDILGDPNKRLNITLLEKLYKVSTNPYDSDAKKDFLNDSTIKKWLEGSKYFPKGSIMSQCSCSS